MYVASGIELDIMLFTLRKLEGMLVGFGVFLCAGISRFLLLTLVTKPLPVRSTNKGTSGGFL